MALDQYGMTDADYDLLNQMRGAGLSFTPNTMYTAIQQPPSPFDNGLANMAFQMLIPMLVGTLSGQGINFMPQAGPGVSPFSAMYSSMYTTPAYNMLQQMAVQQSTQAWGGFAGDIGNRMGLNNLYGMDPASFRTMVSGNMGGMFGGMLSSFGDMTLGNLIRGGQLGPAINTIYANSGLLTTPGGEMQNILLRDSAGNFTSTYDTTVAERRGAYTQALWSKLNSRIYDRPNAEGVMQTYITPDLDYTQGFNVGDIGGKLTGYLAKRGQLRGIDADQAVEVIGQWTKTLKSLSDVMGSQDMDQLLNVVSQLTSGPLTTDKAAALQKSMINLEATAMGLGVSTPEFMAATVQSMGNLTNAAGLIYGGNVNALRTASGRSLTAAGGLQMGQALATNVYAIGSMRQDLSSGALQDIMAEQVGLVSTWMQSPQGRDALMIEWMRENNLIMGDDYQRWQEAVKTGSVAEQQQIAKDILAGQFGSYREAQRLMRDPRYAMQIAAGVSAQGWENMTNIGAVAQGREYVQRQIEQQGARLRNLTSGALSEFEVSTRDITGRGAAQFAAIQEYITGSGFEGSEAAARKLAQIYQAAGGGDAGAYAVQRALRYDEQFQPFRAGAQTAGSLGEAKRVLAYLEKQPQGSLDTPEGLRRARRIETLRDQIMMTELTQDVNAQIEAGYNAARDQATAAGELAPERMTSEQRRAEYIKAIDQRVEQGVITKEQGARLKGQLATTEMYAQGRMGIHGVVRAVEERLAARGLVSAINAQGAKLSDIIAAAGGKVVQGTFYERTAKWIQGETDIFGMLGLEATAGIKKEDMPSYDKFVQMSDEELKTLAGDDPEGKRFAALKAAQDQMKTGAMKTFFGEVKEGVKKNKLATDDKYRASVAKMQAYEQVLGDKMTDEQRELLKTASAQMDAGNMEEAEKTFEKLGKTVSKDTEAKVGTAATQIDEKIKKEVGSDKGKKDKPKMEITIKGTLKVDKDGNATITGGGTAEPTTGAE